MGPFAMPNAEKALQSGQTRPIPCWRIAASNLLTQEIQADFCHHPFAQGTVESILPPAALHALGCQQTFPCCLLSALHRITHRQANGRALFFLQSPSQQERCDRGQGRRRCCTAQVVLLQQLFNALLRPTRCANALDTSAGPVADSSAHWAGS
jgi:hypothetical protein